MPFMSQTVTYRSQLEMKLDFQHLEHSNIADPDHIKYKCKKLRFIYTN